MKKSNVKHHFATTFKHLTKRIMVLVYPSINCFFLHIVCAAPVSNNGLNSPQYQG